MGIFLLLALIMNQFDGSLPRRDQTSSVVAKDKKEEQKERRVRLSPFGSMILPIGYKAFRLTGHIDAWSGYFVSADCSFRVNYSAGLVQTPFETDHDKILWIKTESIQTGLLKYGLKRTKDTEQIIASIGEMNFYITKTKETDLKMVLDLLRTFERGQCQKCESTLSESPSNVNCTATRPKGRS